MLRRVVITGLGLVTPLGCGVEASWSRLLQGHSGARRIEEFEVSDLACQIGCFVPRGPLSEGKFDPNDWMEPKEQRKVDDFIIFAMGAADQALQDAGWKTDTQDKQERTGVLIGSGIGGLDGIAETSILLKEKGPASRQPVLHSRSPDQSGIRIRFHQTRPQGPQSRGRHGVLDRCARDWRCRAPRRPW